ncbi:uncharacterized protein LOC129614003 [Condylostylus longicornis]|uniref:uncharacterized protein LOC129614003 n=1 Tax=Condylostylus longicornis TaxID=2530218 RepID=UPI00244E25ED|nr:uncharacterized protein LOC129614003 [Condylostylus longicornis]
MTKINFNCGCKTIFLTMGFLIIMISETLTFPQSTKFSDKQAILTDGNDKILINTGASLSNRFGGDEIPEVPNSIGYYPYTQNKVPYLIQNPYPYPQLPTIYGVNTVRRPTLKPGLSGSYLNGGFGY